MGCFSGVEQTWASQLDVGRTHIATKGTVQSGLVLNLDAGVSSSYSGIGNTWSDLSVGTGALPIYNTTNSYGTVKSTGTRTDANASSLVLAIPMDGTNNGTTFTDESANIRGSGTAKSITRNGDTKTVTAVSKFYGSSGYFDGSGDSLAVPALGLVSVTFTIEFWVYMSGTASNQIIVTTYNSPGGAQAGAFFFNRSATNQILVADAYGTFVSSSPLNANQWYHAAMVYTHSASRSELFINGVSQGTASFSITAQASSFFIGGSPGDNNTGSAWFNGYLQDFRIYNGVAKYTSNFIPSGSPNNGTLVGSPTYNSRYGGSLVFNGSNDYSSHPYSSLLDLGTQFTISSFIKFNNLSTLNPIFAASNINTGVYTEGYNLHYNAGTIYGMNTNTLRLQFGQNYAQWNVYASNGITITDNNWHFVSVTASNLNTSNPTITFYIDGNSITGTFWNQSSKAAIRYSSNINSPRVASIFYPSSPSYDGPYYFNGRISQVSIYNRALSAAEVSQNYNALKGRYVEPFVTSGLVLNLDAGNTESYPGIGNTWIDLSGNGNNGTMSGATYSSANGGSILISGSSYVNLGDPTTLRFGTGDWTYECWVKTGNLDINTLISKGYSPGFEAFWYGGLLSVYISGAGVNYTGSWSNNTWYHIVFSKINGVYYVYKNGTSFGQTNSTSDISASGTNWWIGQRTGGGYTLNGNISVTRMYNKGFSAAEVLQNYNALKSRYDL
jgi:hypothetical protein